mmetsp:Transcript_4268/g.9302  ORF Transcript_4268/g.9302 Transcript_4268/m.9302 type:complete len:334 (-) Transcript_4268:390-1391(-)
MHGVAPACADDGVAVDRRDAARRKQLIAARIVRLLAPEAESLVDGAEDLLLDVNSGGVSSPARERRRPQREQARLESVRPHDHAVHVVRAALADGLEVLRPHLVRLPRTLLPREVVVVRVRPEPLVEGAGDEGGVWRVLRKHLAGRARLPGRVGLREEVEGEARVLAAALWEAQVADARLLVRVVAHAPTKHVLPARAVRCRRRVASPVLPAVVHDAVHNRTARDVHESVEGVSRGRVARDHDVLVPETSRGFLAPKVAIAGAGHVGEEQRVPSVVLEARLHLPVVNGRVDHFCRIHRHPFAITNLLVPVALSSAKRLRAKWRADACFCSRTV